VCMVVSVSRYAMLLQCAGFTITRCMSMCVVHNNSVYVYVCVCVRARATRCPLCGRKRTNPAADASGHVYCYPCLYNHVQLHGSCSLRVSLSLCVCMCVRVFVCACVCCRCCCCCCCCRCCCYPSSCKCAQLTSTKHKPSTPNVPTPTLSDAPLPPTPLSCALHPLPSGPYQPPVHTDLLLLRKLTSLSGNPATPSTTRVCFLTFPALASHLCGFALIACQVLLPACRAAPLKSADCTNRNNGGAALRVKGLRRAANILADSTAVYIAVT
jgi:hypothetical protein